MTQVKINPFKPMGLASPGMFVGRTAEIATLENALVQTRNGNPVNFLIAGERGIGKSSLLFFIQALALGNLELNYKFNFLAIDADIDESTTTFGLIKKIEMGLRHSLTNSEPARTFLSSTWSFIQRFEGAGFGLKDSTSDSPSDEMLLDEFAYGLAETINRICSDREYLEQDFFSAQFDGVLILIDEADNASDALQLGSFSKLLMERLHRRGCRKLMLGLAGLPKLRTVLRDSHQSSLRLFSDIELSRLSHDETAQVIRSGLEESKRTNGIEIHIDPKAERFLADMSEGFPHFIQQFGYSVFEYDSDNFIDYRDAVEGSLGRNGALEIIGRQYYREDFYNRINKETYRQVLRIMADHLDEWVSKDTIREHFKGSKTTLDNAILALRQRTIIVSKEGVRGVYRLQNKGFAVWIKLYTSNQSDLPPLPPDQPAPG